MDDLPTEILLEIMRYLFGPDLGSLRLINHKFSAAATIVRFRALHVRVTRRGLDNLLNVSRKPELAQGKLPHFGSGHYRSVSGEKERLEKAFFDWYGNNYMAQIRLEDSGECIRTLETALSRMPFIRAIIPGNEKNIFSTRLEFESWCITLTKEEKTCVSKSPYE
ncbi:hypothetical protein RUND412_011419 [Rhizina undulata]